MKTSPLQLETYFVSELHFTVNHTFDPVKEVDLTEDQFIIDVSLLRDETNSDKWQITERIKLQPIATANAPYSFTLELVGFFVAAPSYTADKERLVKTNGPSILYGVAREVVRGITSSGPHKGLVLPSVSFYEPSPTSAKEVADVPQADSKN